MTIDDDESDDIEATIKSVLHALARQRVRLVLRPGNYWVVDLAPPRTEEFNSAVATAFMRGWVAPLANAVPSGYLGPNGELPPSLPDNESVYQLTSAGWDVIHGTHALLVKTYIVAIATLVATIIGAILTVIH